MELVYRSYYIYLQEGGDITKPVSADVQTKAARNVGWKILQSWKVHGVMVLN